jgi:hypothetical protein
MARKIGAAVAGLLGLGLLAVAVFSPSTPSDSKRPQDVAPGAAARPAAEAPVAVPAGEPTAPGPEAAATATADAPVEAAAAPEAPGPENPPAPAAGVEPAAQPAGGAEAGAPPVPGAAPVVDLSKSEPVQYVKQEPVQYAKQDPLQYGKQNAKAGARPPRAAPVAGKAVAGGPTEPVAAPQPEAPTPKVEPAAPPPSPVATGRTESEGSGTLSVSSLPPGAEVFVDGNSVGQTPLDVDVASGSHKVRVVNGGDQKTRTVQIKSGRTADVHISF